MAMPFPDHRWLDPKYVLPPPQPVSWEDYFAWLREDSHAEWVDGAVSILDYSTLDHQDLVGLLLSLLWLASERHEPRSRVIPRFLMRLPSRPSCREPDLAFVAGAHAGRVTTYYIDGPADLVVEIVSPDSVTRDSQEKLAEYEAAGVPEYWIVDPLQRAARFYQLGEDGRYQLGEVDAEDIYTSKVVRGFRLRVDWLWQRPMPTIAAALADLPG